LCTKRGVTESWEWEYFGELEEVLGTRLEPANKEANDREIWNEMMGRRGKEGEGNVTWGTV
jgi:hypothetical protein